MHLLFVDESGKIDQGGLFALGGVAVRDTSWPELRRLWQETLAAHAWPLDQEIKWHLIRKGEVPPRLADDLVAMLAAAPVTALRDAARQTAGTEAHPEFFATPEETYATGLMFLAERFHHLLEEEDDLGMIVVDSRFREEDARLRRFFADLTKDGTPFMQLPRIVEGLFLGPSHYSIGLQCADLVVAMTANAERGPGQARGYLESACRGSRASRDGRARRRRHQAVPEQVPRERGRNRLF